MQKLSWLAAAVSLALSGSSASSMPLQAAAESSWSLHFDLPGVDQLPQRLVPTSDGGVFAVERLSINSSAAGVIGAKFNANGDLQWQLRRPLSGTLPGLWYDRASDAVTGPGGDIYFVIGDQPEGELLRLNSVTGAVVWSVPLPSITTHLFYPTTVVADPAGRIVVGGSRVGAGGQQGRFEVQAFDVNGTRLWGNTSVTGTLHGMGVDPSTGEVVAYGQSNVFSQFLFGVVARYSSTGSPMWSVGSSTPGIIDWDWGSVWYDSVDALDFDAAGNAYALVNGNAGVDPDTNPYAFSLQAFSPSGSTIYDSLYVAEYEYLSSTVTEMRANAMSVDAAGNVYIVGHERTCVGGCPSQFTIWAYDPAGLLRWKEVPSSAGGNFSAGYAVTIDDDGRILVHGWTDLNGGEAIDASFLADGTELGSSRSPGASVGQAQARLGFAADARGNSFLATYAGDRGGNFEFTATGITRFMAGGEVGSSYCGPTVSNSTGGPAVLKALGRDSASGNNVSLRAEQLPAGAAAFFLTSRVAGSVPAVGGGQGTLCLGGAIGRYVGPGQVRATSAGGAVWLDLDLADLPQPTGGVQGAAGETWRFQVWYRDANPTVTSNLSNGVSLTLGN